MVQLPVVLLVTKAMTYQMVRYRSRGMALRPINRIKHVVDANYVLASNTVLAQEIAGATDTPTLAVNNSVETGSKINGIYMKIEVIANESAAGGTIPNVYLAVYKNPGGNLTFPNPNAVGVDDNKRFVIHQEMLMFNGVVQGVPRVLFNGVIALPKGMRRFGPNDKLIAAVFAPNVNIMLCYQIHYKEFR